MSHRFLDHTGDTAVELEGDSESELVREAAGALLEILLDAENGAPATAREHRELSLEAEDGETLLIDFLNELIFLFDSEGFLCAEVDIRDVALGKPARLRARLGGETFDVARHVAFTEVKAATFHDLAIERRAIKLRCRVVFDL